MRFNRKAQAAMEFLMTYGWAILVVLVVIGALVYMGVLNPMAMVPEKCTAPSGFICNSVSMNSNQLQMILTPQINGKSGNITFNAVTPTTFSVTESTGNDFLTGKPKTLTATVNPPAGGLRVGSKVRLGFDISYIDEFGLRKSAPGGEIVVVIG